MKDGGGIISDIEDNLSGNLHARVSITYGLFSNC